jgi:hypothetical protein
MVGSRIRPVQAPTSFGSVELDGYANVKHIGAVKPKKVKLVASSVAFGPPADPDVTKDLDFGVTRLFGRLYFSLDPNDVIVLPDSATVSVEGPERPSPTPTPTPTPTPATGCISNGCHLNNICKLDSDRD